MLERLHSFGGSALDRHVFDYETVEGVGELGTGVEAVAPTGDTSGAAGDTAVTDPPAETVEGAPPSESSVAPAWSPEQFNALRESPEFRDLVAEEAGTIAEQRLQEVLSRFGEQQPGEQPGEQIDPSEFLNPMSDDFGGNLLGLLAQRDQFILGEMQKLFQPVQQRYQNETLQEGQQRVQDVIADDFSRNGEIALGEDAGIDPKQVIGDIAPLFLSEMESRYGKGTARAAEQSITKAASVVRGLVTAAEKSGAAKATNQLATIAGGNTEVGAGTGAVRGTSEADSVEDALARFRERAVA